MQFTSYIFIFLMLPITIMGYFGANRINYNLGKYFLIILSLLFFAPAGWVGITFFTGSIVVNYGIVKIMSVIGMNDLSLQRNHKRKTILVVGICINILLLLYCKYLNFFIDNINLILKTDIIESKLILPLGISFYTFQQISYLVDLYSGELSDNEKGIFNYLLYITFFPKLLMGPIAFPKQLIQQFNDTEKKKFNSDNFIFGIQLFSIGLFKKTILADVFQRAVNWGNSGIEVTSLDIIVLMLSYTFLIYFDFSGYSDMATGVSKMLNIELPVNFDSPYKAITIADFWKRWHISLTKFFTKYVYIPMGGNRKGVKRTIINAFIVFLISGFWHGANWTFILWGIIHGILYIISKNITPKRMISKLLAWVITFTFVNLLWFLFQATSITEWINSIRIIFSFENMSLSNGLASAFAIPEYNIIAKLVGIDRLGEWIYGLESIIAVGLSTLLCMAFSNSMKQRKKTVFWAAFCAILLFWGILGLGQEAVFIYNMF